MADTQLYRRRSNGCYPVRHSDQWPHVQQINAYFTSLEASINSRFEAVNTRFDYMRELWRNELRHPEEVLDAKLHHLEEEGR